MKDDLKHNAIFVFFFKCSKTCGSGVQTRTVGCFFNQSFVHDDYCNLSSKGKYHDTVRICQLESCPTRISESVVSVCKNRQNFVDLKLIQMIFLINRKCHVLSVTLSLQITGGPVIGVLATRIAKGIERCAVVVYTGMFLVQSTGDHSANASAASLNTYQTGLT